MTRSMPPARLVVTGLIALAAGLCTAGCTGDGGVKDEELEGLVVSRSEAPAAIDVARAATSAQELARAFAEPHQRVGEVGAHTAKITTRIEVKEGAKVVEQLSDELTLELAADGQFHARLDNSADYGREVLFKDGLLYLRPRYARWHRRPPTDEHEVGALRDQLFAALGDHFDLVAHAAEVSDKGAAEVAGRAGRRVEIKRAPSPGKPRAQPIAQRKWRESVTVTALSGDAVLDAERGFPLQARFTAQLTFNRDGRSFDMTLEVGHDLAGFGQPLPEGALALPPPEEIVDTPQRLREVDERDALLEGMAPPARQSGAATGPSGRGPEPTAPPPPPPGKAGGE